MNISTIYALGHNLSCQQQNEKDKFKIWVVACTIEYVIQRTEKSSGSQIIRINDEYRQHLHILNLDNIVLEYGIHKS